MDKYVALTAKLSEPRFASMTAAEAAADLNSANIATERPAVSGSEIYNALDRGERAVISPAQDDLVREILSLGDVIDVRAGTNVRTVLLSIFGAGTVSRAKLAALVTRNVSWAESSGFGPVGPGDVDRARS